ncbi:carboxypeptidase-like regulatory domain-containing protein [Methanocella arvoryzae]|uniref:Carboxypeptidase regulatory-like domain-containing protein n=1 Tax=Methanocella arvoryzae (strain DSM 22066 / NBRC 105507 / MRE50) TaxID=351160 RepID=Q0W5N6_METAR|nr:carboxypeptidase-like regulatory domain-containing protein [Methanocella arvoryzae]CAJ36307.1 hypothetical protein RCIX968 [Methanocella arvoryzae MRE50]
MMETRKLITGLLILATIVLAAYGAATAAVSAQAAGNSGTVTGTIYDSIGNLVPDADVYLCDDQGIVTGLTATDGNGTYTYTELDPGNYSVIVQVDGYAWHKKFRVSAGALNESNVYIPDYIHYPMVTPWPALNAKDNSTSTDNTKVATVTPTPEPARTNETIVHTAPDMSPEVESGPAGEEESGGSPLDDFINGIVSFFKSILGMPE